MPHLCLRLVLAQAVTCLEIPPTFPLTHAFRCQFMLYPHPRPQAESGVPPCFPLQPWSLCVLSVCSQVRPHPALDYELSKDRG